MRTYYSLVQRIVVCVAMVIASVSAKAQFQTAQVAITVNIANSNCGGYWESLPIGYNTSTKYPVLIYVHGNGVYGNGSASAMAPILNQGVPLVIKNGQFPSSFTVNGRTSSMIVISPQFRARATAAETNAFIDYIINRYSVDKGRVYLTGFSVGGDVAWKAPSSTANAIKLAALVPTAGYNSPYTDGTAQFIAAGNLPTWAIHSNADGVPVAWSISMVEKINSFNPITPAIISRPNGWSHEVSHVEIYKPSYRPAPTNLNVYEWCLTKSRNYAPNANAGNDQSITLPTNSTNLSSAGSNDPENSTLTFAWSKIAGPSQFTITTTTSANPAVSNLVAGVYQFQLQVTDVAGAVDLDTVRVTVINPNPNVLPIAAAGNDVSINLPQTSVSMSGNGSVDPDGIIESYTWTKYSGPSQFTITSPNTVNTSITGLKTGVYQFILAVTDNQGAIGRDTVKVTVVNPFPNVAPVARAGADIAVTLPLTSVALSGSASTDADGVLTAYAWRQVSGPNTSTITNATQQNATISNLVVGTYQYELKVTDDSLATDLDTVAVLVTLSDNIIKVNVYGGTIPAGTGWNNWNVQSNLTLSSSTYSNGSPSPMTATLNVSNAVADNGATYPVTMCPVEVGRTTSYSTVGRILTLSGLNNSKKYNLEVYASRGGSGNSTRFTVGTTAVTINTGDNYANKAAFTNITPVSGQIRVTIDRLNTYNYLNGFILSEAVSGPVVNQPPVAVVTPNQTITLPTSQVTLSGTGSYDNDGTITNYDWTELSTGGGNITTPAGSSTTVTGLTPGVYQYQLTVTDNQGATATSNVTVTVNQPYIPPTGGDVINCGKVFKIVVLGSSTAVGTGSNPIDSAWLNKYRGYVRSKNTNSLVISLAASGFTTYHALNPNWYTAPAGRPAADTAKNITKALTYNPDLIIVNLPSNDAAQNFTLAEQQANYERMMAIADSMNIPVFVSTTQPRNGMSAAQMTSLTTMRDWILQRFGSKAINFWETIANADGTINALYNSDGVHLVNAGHHILYTRAVAARILDTLCIRKNITPIANAGNNFNILLPLDSIQLSSAGTSDPDGTIASYAWTKISGPTQYSFSNATIANPKLRNLTNGVYQVSLTVTDNLGASASDTITVTVTSPAPQPPIARAGNDRTITLPVNSVQLSGSTSGDPDGTIAGYLWRLIEGSLVNEIDSTIANPTIADLTEGVYKFELTVTDNSGMTDTDSVTVTVLPVPNQLPVAKAGSDILVIYPGSSTELNGTASTDNDGSITSYAWARLPGGPASFSIDDATTATPVISDLSPGVYSIQLTVTDDDGATHKDTVRVTVGGAPNIAPVANAGSDNYRVLPANSIQLNSSASSDPDGVIAQRNWLKIAGPASFTISSNSAVSPTISNLTAGVYEIQLTITDDSLAIAKDTVVITVYPPLNTLPIARAGNDQSITLPVNSVALSGSTSTDANGTIIGYAWEQVSGPAQAVFSADASVNTNANSLVAGTYQFRLTVTDDSLTVGTDIVQVIVNPVPTTITKYVQVNVFGGTNPAGTGWNNWNVASNLNLTATTYTDGTASPVRANINVSNGVADNGATYPVTMCPVLVGRTTSFSTVMRLVNITGLDNTKRYDLEAYSSRSGTGNTTKMTVGTTVINILSSNNYASKATWTNIAPSGGQIQLKLERLNTYNYINGFILTEKTNTAARTMEAPVTLNSAPTEESARDAAVSTVPMGLYPNPAMDVLAFSVNNDHSGELNVSLVNQYGKTVKQYRFTKTEGTFNRNIDLHDLAPGLYFIKAEMKKWKQTGKMMKM